MKKKIFAAITGSAFLLGHAFAQCRVKPPCTNEVNISGTLQNQTYTGSTCFAGSGSIASSVNVINWQFLSFSGAITYEQVPNLTNQNFYTSGDIKLLDNDLSLGGTDTIFVDGSLAIQSNFFNLNGKVVVILNNSSSTVKIQGTTYSAGDTLKGNNYPASGQYIAITSCQDISGLPITLSLFTAKAGSKNVVLKWNTSSEINNQDFAVQRSTDGSDWKAIGIVNSKAPNGNSNQLLSYMYNDNAPANGINYYRLQQTGLDGKQVFTKTVSVDFTGTADLQAYPNPAHGVVNIDGLTIGAGVSIYNANGKLIKTFTATAASHQIDIAGWAGGVYFVKAGTDKVSFIVN